MQLDHSNCPATAALRRGRRCAWIAALALLAGCGGANYDHADLEGQVTVAGAPLAEGSISFLPVAKGQGPATGGTIVNGAYQASKVPLGEVKVMFNAIRKTKRLPDDAGGMERWETENLIPVDKRQGVTLKVEKGMTHYDFSL